VIALRGDTHVARVGASILTHVGHPELLAETADDYVRISAELAGNKMRRVAFRTGLRDAIVASPLGDVDGFAAKVEAAYADMWRRFARGAQNG
jgi:predicted O-linked N-acetylglucosamine transferase (SPINDLY family)